MSYQPPRRTSEIYLSLAKAIVDLREDEEQYLLDALYHLSQRDGQAVRALFLQTLTALARSEDITPTEVWASFVERHQLDDEDSWASFAAEAKISDLEQALLLHADETDIPAEETL